MPELTGWPTDGAEGSVSSEARWRAMARLFAPSGVVTGLLGELAPTLGAGVVNVAAGAAFLDGHYCESLTATSVSSTANGLAVIRFTPADNTFELLWRDGATNPTQTDATWELPIAQTVAGVLTDRRLRTHPGPATWLGTATALIATPLPVPAAARIANVTGVVKLNGASNTADTLLALRWNGDATTVYPRSQWVSTNTTPAVTGSFSAGGSLARIATVPSSGAGHSLFDAQVNLDDGTWTWRAMAVSSQETIWINESGAGSYDPTVRVTTISALLSGGGAAFPEVVGSFIRIEFV